jgi:hypothetical protein
MAQGFNIAPGTSAEDLSLRRRLAASMLQQGTDTSPIQSPWQGAARMAQALIGGGQIGQMREEESLEKAAYQQQLAGILGGGSPTAPAAAPSAFDPGDTEMQSALTAQNGRATPQPTAPMGAPAGAPDVSGLVGNRFAEPLLQALAAKKLEAQFAPKDTDVQRNYNIAKGQGFKGSLLDYQMALKRAGANVNNVTVGGGKYGTIPPGFELVETPQGAQMRPIPGSPAAMDIKEGEVKAASIAEQRKKYADVVTEDIDRTLKMVEESPATTTGPGGAVLSGVPGLSAHNVGALVETIKANAGFDRLQEMRAASPTGGALGQVSDFENKLLQATIGNLSQSQNKEQFVYNLKRVRDIYGKIIHEGIKPGSQDGGGGKAKQKTSTGVEWSVD